MLLVYAIIIVLTNCLFMVGSYWVWPSRWNIPAHLQVGFCITYFVIPAFGTNVLVNVRESTLDTYVIIQMLSATAYFIGLVLGSDAARRQKSDTLLKAWRLDPVLVEKCVTLNVRIALMVGIAGLAICFVGMGFVPMFAKDPLAAKFFRGVYQKAYSHFAIPFRSSFYILITTIPIGLILFYMRRKLIDLALAGTGAVCVAMTLTRGPAAQGILLAMGVAAAYNRRWFIPFIITVIVAVPVGSAAYYILGSAMGNTAIYKQYRRDQGVCDMIASGAPDISDQLQLLEAFERKPDYTYGRTFVGGLVPYNYKWNPSVWSLTVLNARGSDDVSNTISGGLRLSCAIWGYVSFGMFGAFAIPFLSGLFVGIFNGMAKRRVGTAGPLIAMLAITLLMVANLNFIEFFRLSIYALPSTTVILVLTHFSLVRKAETVQAPPGLQVSPIAGGGPLPLAGPSMVLG